MTTDQKPWRAEIPQPYGTAWHCGLEPMSHGGWCLAHDTRKLVTKCNAELDAARAQVKLLESEAKRYASISAADDAYLEECSGELERAGVPVYDSQGVSRGLKCRIIELTRERDAARARIAELEASEAMYRRAIENMRSHRERADIRDRELSVLLCDALDAARKARSHLSDVICCLVQEANEGDGLREEHYTIVKNAKLFLGHAIHEDCLLTKETI